MISTSPSHALRLTDVVRALGPTKGAMDHEGPRAFSSVAADARSVTPGSLFVALEMEGGDGHAHILGAIARGAFGIVVAEGRAPSLDFGVDVIEMKDTLRAYRSLAALWRQQFEVPIIAVAGSAGKTTTKEMLASMLRGRFGDVAGSKRNGSQVLQTQGNQNGFFGVASTLLSLRAHHRAVVIEVGIDAEHAMADHMRIMGATHAVVTCIGPEHLDGLRDVERVAREETTALSCVADRGGTVVLNLDEEAVRSWHERHPKARSAAFTLDPGRPCDGKFDVESHLRNRPDCPLLIGRLEHGGTSLRFESAEEPGLDSEPLPLPMPGVHNARNLLAAATVARSMGLSVHEMTCGLGTMTLPPARCQLAQLAHGVVAIYDFYNANPRSTSAALDLLTQRTFGRRSGACWACLGDMLELGTAEERLHRDLAKPIAVARIEHVLLIGDRMRWLEQELRAIGFSGNVTRFDTHAAMGEELARSVQPGDTVLLKGSRAMKMEEVVRAAMRAIATRAAPG